MTDLNSLVQRYLDGFNETDPARRAELLEATYTADSRYTDPQVDLHGAAEIEAFIAATQERFPGYRFTLGGDVDAHHDQARFQWHAAPDGAAEPEYIGFDVIDGADGRVQRVYGFMDRAPVA
ncbi:MAG TPA: nuclear transport factor 2 family protein [Solirubrobacteraceae bacterium]|jgi:hypothetical protein|nr:nuclear transport factor 2 family protein [Solirubrobacteraceae bacterium]